MLPDPAEWEATRSVPLPLPALSDALGRDPLGPLELLLLDSEKPLLSLDSIGEPEPLATPGGVEALEDTGPDSPTASATPAAAAAAESPPNP